MHDGTRGRRRLATWLGAVLLLAGLLLPAAASAAPTWLAPVQVGPLDTGTCLYFTYTCDVDIAVAPDGTAFAAMAIHDADHGNHLRAATAIRPPGGSFGAFQFLSPADADVAGSNGEQVRVAVDPAGGATATWAYADAGTGTNLVQASYHAPGSAGFSAPQQVSPSASTASSPSVAAFDGGGAIIAWADTLGGSSSVKVRLRQPGDTTFTGSATTISTIAAGAMSSLKVVAAPDGTAAATWAQTNVVYGNRRPAGGSFASTGTPLSGSPSASPDVAITPGGRVTAIWSFYDGSANQIQAKETNTSGTWPPGVQTLEPGTSPSVAVDPADNAVAVWNGTGGVRAGDRATGAQFRNLTPISGAGASPFVPEIAVSPSGDALATWSLSDGSSEVVQGARKPLGASWGGVDTIMQGGARPDGRTKGVWFRPPPRVAFDDQGNAFGSWVGYLSGGSSTTNLVEVAAFDAAPPSLSGVGAPNATTVGQVATFSANAADRVGPTTVTWSFGDGQTGSGAAVSHAFATPGAYSVTVTATDQAGKTASATRTVQVSSPPPTGGGGGTPGGGGGVTPTAMVPAKPAARWSVKGAKLTLTSLAIKPLPRGWAVTAACRGRKCPFTSRKLKDRKLKSGTFNALKAMGRKHTFHAGQTFELRIAAKGYSTRVVQYRLRAGKKPKARTLCLPPGARKPTKTCG